MPPPDYQPEINPLSTTSASQKSYINLPERQDNMPSGTTIGKSLLYSTGQQRDNAFIEQILSGNIPDRMREFVPITVMKNGNTIQYFCSRDYLSVGSDEDYLRVVLNGNTAKKICDTLNCMLPTKVIVDTIWQLSDLRLSPHPMLANPNMISTKTLIDHNNAINTQVGGRDFNLISGIKKDIVISKHLLSDRSRLCIYGWHQLNGTAIQQQNSTSHGIFYEDYSQSLRWVSRNALLNNQPVDLYDVLNSPQYCYLISEESNYDPSTIYT